MAKFKLLRIPIPIENVPCQICRKNKVNQAGVMVILFPKAIIAEDLPLVCSECKSTIQNESDFPHPATLNFPREMPSREEAILAALHKQEVETIQELKGEVINFDPSENVSTPSEVIRIVYPKAPRHRSRLKRLRPRKDTKNFDNSSINES